MKKRNRPQYISGKVHGNFNFEARFIHKVPKYKPIKALFCSHDVVIKGESCSEYGLRRISGEDIYACCLKCGKILSEEHRNY